jgi:hypothetical protein
MRTLRLCAILTLGLALGYAIADAAQKARCCAKAEREGKQCDHVCCVEAARAGKQCEKCGGKN